MSWRLGTLVSEAWLNLRSSGIRSLLMLGMTAAALGALAFLELRDSGRAIDLSERYMAAGGYVAVVDGTGGRIDAGTCEALNNEAHVVGAGAIGRTELVSFGQAPNTLFSRVSVTPGLLAVWAPRSTVAQAELAGGLVIGPALSSEMGLAPGDFTSVEGEALRVAGVADVTQRNPIAARWAMAIAPPTGPAEQCWVELRPESYSAALLALPAWFARGGEAPAARPYTRQDEFSRDPAEEFAGRAQRNGWLVGGALVGVLFWLMAWFRRSELGLYMALGTPRTAVAFAQAMEGLVLTACAWSIGVVYAIAAHAALDRGFSVEQLTIAIRTSLSAALVTLALLPLGPLVIVRGNILELLKDR